MVPLAETDGQAGTPPWSEILEFATRALERFSASDLQRMRRDS